MNKARAVGHVAWWVFVVSVLFRRSPEPGPRRYADYLPVDEQGWTAYIGLTDGASMPEAGFAALNTLAMITLVAAVVTVAAAVVEAALGGRWSTGIVAVAAPIVGGLLVIVAARGGIGDYRFAWWLAFALILAGVAIREVVARYFRPI